MKKILTCLILSVFCLLVNAQQNHFIYLQTENSQPFFVKFNNRILNSNPLGYLIIPKLDDGIYSLVIGFPGSNNEQEFNCTIKNKDVGFIIKNAAEKQWQLLNLQTLAFIQPGDVINKPVIVYDKETDPFSTMLANAVHDSTILRKVIIPEKSTVEIQKDSSGISSTNDVVTTKQSSIVVSDSGKKEIVIQTLPAKNDKINTNDSSVSVALNNNAVTTKVDSTLTTDAGKKEVTKEIIPEKSAEQNQKDSSAAIVTDPVTLVTKKDSVEVTKTSLVKSNEIKDSTVSTNPTSNITLLKSVIKRKLKKTSKDGMEMMYVDDDGNAKDTIRVFIPNDKKRQSEEVQPETVSVMQPVPAAVIPKEDSSKNKTEVLLPKQENEGNKQSTKQPVFINSIMINSDCKNFATEDDFLKIRKKMVAENNDEDMIKVAKKYFKTKCFTTEQIKNLSVLFLKDENKYMFYDMAYAFVSDSDLYYTLEKQLTDNYYITRFRAMIHK